MLTILESRFNECMPSLVEQISKRYLYKYSRLKMFSVPTTKNKLDKEFKRLVAQTKFLLNFFFLLIIIIPHYVLNNNTSKRNFKFHRYTICKLSHWLTQICKPNCE